MSIVGEQLPAPGSPGRRARRIVLRLRMRTLVALGLLAIQTTFAGRAFGLRSALFVGSELLLLLAILLIYRYVLPLVDRHDRGAKGEEHVGGLLDTLVEEGWHVIHDANFGRGDIDHVAIGPPGIFTVETKSHAGPVSVGRLHGALLRQAQAQRRLLERSIGMPVEPLIVYSRAWIDRPLARRKGVRVLPARMLLGYLAEREPQMSAEQAAQAHLRVLKGLSAARAAEAIAAHECDGRQRASTGARGSLLRRARDRSHRS